MAQAAAIIDDDHALGELRADWDRLAVRCGEPYCAPAWMLAWWRYARPDGAGLRIAVSQDDTGLIGLAPMWAERSSFRSSRYEILTERFSPPAGLLLAPGREQEALRSLAAGLAAARPRPTQVRLWDGSSERLAGLADAWPGRRPWVHQEPAIAVPVASLDGLDYEAWFAGRSSKFRQESRRLRRRLEDEGARFAMVGLDGLERAVDAFIALHAARWRDRGGSGALVPGLRELLSEVGRELLPVGRLRVFTIEVDGEVIAANLLLAAGDVVNGWNSGFDDRWRRFSPSMQLTLHALEDAIQRGDRIMSLGPGDRHYKRRIADREDEISRLTLVPFGRAYPRARLAHAVHDARRDAAARVPERLKTRLRVIRRG